jgi:UDP-N-acetyl-D-galactosamine dehydrogenase
VKHEYDVDLCTELGNNYGAIILAVSHDKFRAIDISTLKANDAVVFDIKAFFDVSEIDARL